MTQGGPRGVEEDLADVRASMGSRRAGAGFAALSGVWCESDEGGDLFGGEEAELRQVGDEGGGGDRADALDGAQELGELGGLGIPVDGLGNVGLDGVEAIAQSGDHELQVLSHGLFGGQREAAAFGMEGAGELGAPGGQGTQDVISQDGRAHPMSDQLLGGECRDQLGVDAVRLGLDASALAEGDDIIGMDPDEQDGFYPACRGDSLRNVKIGVTEASSDRHGG